MIPPPLDRPVVEFELAGALLRIERTSTRGERAAVALYRTAPRAEIAAAYAERFGASPDEARDVADEIRRRLGA